ncbi:hypothetical protein ABEB36_005836 [Hypothenemus hampei]|uniref:CLIP domain-containing serine protease n=1 Tax=Hypothenemus hampei TaxID=57062 RepID=A0ABD1F087_HYPHA
MKFVMCRYFISLCFFCYSVIGLDSFPKYKCTDVSTCLKNSSEVATEGFESESVTSSQEEYDLTKHLNLSLRFATPCETPNLEVTLCIKISKCSTLDEVKNKKKYADFVLASKCGPNDESKDEDYLVCCGKYNNFRNKSTDTTERSKTKPIFDDSIILPENCGIQRQIIRGRIVGGSEATLGEYPWMARIIHKNINGVKSFGCAGFLIHPKYVVTAAHCIHSKFTEIRGAPYSVLLGEHNTTSKIDCSPGGTFCADPVQISRVTKIIVHKNYDRSSNNHHNDIALLYLNKAVKLTDFVQPICLASEESIPKKYYMSGWGKTETAESSPVKMKVDLVAFDKVLCKNKFQMIDLEISESQLCAGGEKLKDSCNGDSGGPLMIFNGTHYFASGLVSYGIGCGMKDWPGVYTSIPHYLNWIKIQMLDINAKAPKLKKLKKDKKNKNKKT